MPARRRRRCPRARPGRPRRRRCDRAPPARCRRWAPPRRGAPRPPRAALLSSIAAGDSLPGARWLILGPPGSKGRPRHPMASLRDIRKRIRSVKSTQQITKAMKMVSAAKLRRAQDAIIAARPYARALDQMIADLVSRERGPVATRCSPPRPIAGWRSSPSPPTVAWPAASTPTSSAAWPLPLRERDRPYAPSGMTTVGRKGGEFFRRAAQTARTSPASTPSSRYETAPEAGGRADPGRSSTARSTPVYVLYNEFVSAITQKSDARRRSCRSRPRSRGDAGKPRCPGRLQVRAVRRRRCSTRWCRRRWPSESTGRCSRVGGLRARRPHERDGERDQQRRGRHLQLTLDYNRTRQAVDHQGADGDRLRRRGAEVDAISACRTERHRQRTR